MNWAEKVRNVSGRWPAPSRELVLRVLGGRSDDDITTAAADYLRKHAEAERLTSMASDARAAEAAAWSELEQECLKVEARPDAFEGTRAHVERLRVEPPARQSER